MEKTNASKNNKPTNPIVSINLRVQISGLIINLLFLILVLILVINYKDLILNTNKYIQDEYYPIDISIYWNKYHKLFVDCLISFTVFQLLINLIFFISVWMNSNTVIRKEKQWIWIVFFTIVPIVNLIPCLVCYLMKNKRKQYYIDNPIKYSEDDEDSVEKEEKDNDYIIVKKRVY